MLILTSCYFFMQLLSEPDPWKAFAVHRRAHRFHRFDCSVIVKFGSPCVGQGACMSETPPEGDSEPRSKSEGATGAV